MDRRNPDYLIYALGALIVAVLALMVYGVLAKPVIGYSLSSDVPIGNSSAGDAPIRFGLSARNSGGLPGDFVLVARCYNVTFADTGGYEVVSTVGYSELHVSLGLGSGEASEGVVSFSLKPMSGATYILVFVSARIDMSGGPVRGYSSSFSSFSTVGANTALFALQNGDYVRQGKAELNSYLSSHPSVR